MIWEREQGDEGSAGDFVGVMGREGEPNRAREQEYCPFLSVLIVLHDGYGAFEFSFELGGRAYLQEGPPQVRSADAQGKESTNCVHDAWSLTSFVVFVEDASSESEKSGRECRTKEGANYPLR